jgi:uncharacterized protein
MSSGERSTGSTKYLFDTYALIEVYAGNPAYKPFISAPFFVTLLNLFEFHQYLLRTGSRELANRIVDDFSANLQQFSMDVVKKASALRHAWRKRSVSMTDCIGYVAARENGLRFLTGDREFSGAANVEFVK